MGKNVKGIEGVLKVLKKKRVCQAEGEKCGVYAGKKLPNDVPGAVWGGVKDLDDCCFYLDCHEIEVNGKEEKRCTKSRRFVLIPFKNVKGIEGVLKVLKKKRVCQPEGEKCGVNAGRKLGTDVPGAVWGGVKDLD